MFLFIISPIAIQAMNRYLENPILRKTIQDTPNKQTVADIGFILDGKPTNLRLTIAQLVRGDDLPDYFKLKSELMLDHVRSALTWSKEYEGELSLVGSSSIICGPHNFSSEEVEAMAYVNSEGGIARTYQESPGSYIMPHEGPSLFQAHGEAHSKGLIEVLSK